MVVGRASTYLPSLKYSLAAQSSVAIRTARDYGVMAQWAAQLQSIQQLGARNILVRSVRPPESTEATAGTDAGW